MAGNIQIYKKKIKASITGDITGEGNISYTVDGVALQVIYPNGQNVSKTVTIKDGNNSKILSDKYSNIQILFNKDKNIIYTQIESDQSEFVETYSGNISSLSIKDSKSEKTIKVNKTGGEDAGDWLIMYPQGTGEISEILIEDEITPSASGLTGTNRSIKVLFPIF